MTAPSEETAPDQCKACSGSGFVAGDVATYLTQHPDLASEVIYWPMNRVPCEACEAQGHQAAALDKAHCCHTDCDKDAEFSIHGSSGHFEDVTESCEDHVGALLGTPTWLQKENESWSIFPIAYSQPLAVSSEERLKG